MHFKNAFQNCISKLHFKNACENATQKRIQFLPSSEEDVAGLLDILGEDRFRDDLEAPLPFLETRLDSAGV